MEASEPIAKRLMFALVFELISCDLWDYSVLFTCWNISLTDAHGRIQVMGNAWPPAFVM